MPATLPTSRRGTSPALRTLLIVALVIGVPILEVWLLIKAGHLIGVLPTLLVLVAEAIVGTWLLKREGVRAWRALVASVKRGSLPVDEATDAALVLVGGVLLILPGFFTDLLGLVFLLPFTRPLARRLVQLLVARRVDLSGLGTVRSRVNLDGQTIRGETVDAPEPGPRGASAVRRQLDAEVVEGTVID